MFNLQYSIVMNGCLFDCPVPSYVAAETPLFNRKDRGHTYNHESNRKDRGHTYNHESWAIDPLCLLLHDRDGHAT